MSYLYITEDGASVNVDGGYYSVNYRDGLVHKIPSETLESVALFGNVSISAPCIKKFLENGIPVSYFQKEVLILGGLNQQGTSISLGLSVRFICRMMRIFQITLQKE